MDGHVIALRNDAPFGVKDRAGIIASLFDVGRERSAPQRRAHLLRDRSIERAIDFKCGWIKQFHVRTACGSGRFTLRMNELRIRHQPPATAGGSSDSLADL